MTDLEIIRTEVYGEPVRASIANELESLSAGSVDITEELETIRNGRYGIDIRMAIYHALVKLHLRPPSPTPTGDVGTVKQLRWAMNAVKAAKVAQFQEIPWSWTCDSGWYFPGPVTANLWGRDYPKSDNHPSIGFIAHVDAGATAVIHISDDPDAVYNGWVGASEHVISFGGHTWYYTRCDYWMGGIMDDGSGHLQTFPETLIFEGSATNSITPTGILRVMDYVNLSVTEGGNNSGV